MNPQAVRAAIKSGLDARSAWDDIDMSGYPLGDRAEHVGTLELGIVADGGTDLLDLGNDSADDTYRIQLRIWLPGNGAKESDFETTETAMVNLLADLRTWLETVAYGKALGVATCDSLTLPSWEYGFTADGGCVMEGTFAVTEYS